MDFRRAIPSLTVLVAVACSSGGDSGVTPKNDPPTVVFTFAKLAVPRGESADLTVSANDPDGDKLTINWSITRNNNTLTPLNTSRTIMRWVAPFTEGTDTVTIRVSDGTVNRTVTAVLKVGRPTNETALPVYEKIKSPYIITLPDAEPTLTISGSTVIEPGVELLFETPGSILRVLGRLEAIGTADLPIVFRPNDRTFRCGDEERGWWEGIRGATEFGSDGDIELEYAEVWYAQTGVRLNDNASATVRNCSFRCSGNAGLLMGGNGTLILLDSKINNGRVDGVSVSAFVSLPDSVLIQGCAIEINGGAGLRLDLADPSQSAPIVIEYNTIHFNKEHGISLARAVFPRIHHNSFTGNGESTVSNIYLQTGYPDGVAFPELDATCNFWGAVISSQVAIDQTIRDSLDSGSVATRVKSCPWLNESPITTPPDCSMSCP